MHIRNFKYKGAQRKNLKIVQISPMKYRVEYHEKFLWFTIRDIKLKVETVHYIDASEIEESELIFDNIEDAEWYVRKATRKLICFKRFKEVVLK
jgi:hypothetical protein